MYLFDVLDKAYKTRPNALHKEIVVDQLIRGVEGDVAEMFHVDPPEYVWNDEDPEDIELLMPHPYDDIYFWYLCAMIDLLQEETELYMNDMSVFNAAWARAQAWYRRNTPTKRKKNWRTM